MEFPILGGGGPVKIAGVQKLSISFLAEGDVAVPDEQIAAFAGAQGYAVPTRDLGDVATGE